MLCVSCGEKDYVPQLRHTSAAHFIPTLDPTAGFVTPGPCSMTSPIPI